MCELPSRHYLRGPLNCRNVKPTSRSLRCSIERKIENLLICGNLLIPRTAKLDVAHNHQVCTNSFSLIFSNRWIRSSHHYQCTRFAIPESRVLHQLITLSTGLCHLNIRTGTCRDRCLWTF